GQDTLTGGAGVDHFVVYWDGDRITDFTSGTDMIHLDGYSLSSLGAGGNFAAGDPRFYAAPGATAGHDADDRVVYNTSTGELFYDWDGSGTNPALLLAVLQPGATLVATDIVVDHASPAAGTIVNGNGFAGNDTLDGGAGTDSMVGGTGDDLYFVENYSDQVVELANEGRDEVVSSSYDYSLANGVENLTLIGSAHNGYGNALDNLITGNAGANLLWGGSGNDTIIGGAGADTIYGNDGNDSLVGGADNDMFAQYSFTTAPGVDTVDGGAGNDTLDFRYMPTAVTANFTTGIVAGGGYDGSGSTNFVNVEGVIGSYGGDLLIGGAGSENLDGYAGDDTITGGAGNDTLTGGDGADHFVFSAVPGDANADLITDFTGMDRIHLDATVMMALGAGGQMSSMDARFYAAAGATGGHDADDRVVYDTASGKLYYDADGSGSGTAQLVATLQSTPVLAGTTGNDSLVGTLGNDTINGLDGNDTLDGQGGADSMVGGAGDDVYYVDNPGDVVVEQINAGMDEVRSSLFDYILPDWVNNLTLVGNAFAGHGNAIDNLIVGNARDNWIDAGDGNDSIDGGLGNDTIYGGAGDDTMQGGPGADYFYITGGASGGPGHDVIDGGSPSSGDWLRYDEAQSGAVIDLRAGTATGGGANGTGSATIRNIQHVMGSSFGDTIIADDQWSQLFGGDGNDTIDAGNGADQVWGGAGADSFILAQDPSAWDVWIRDFAPGVDNLHLDARVMPALGASGNFAVNDPRFYAAAGASSGHDADDRIIYDTLNGGLYYDPDGNGSNPSQIIATFAYYSGGVPTPLIQATDLVVDNAAPGVVINGTSGNDSLVGTNGNDTINGLDGNDTIDGGAGADSLVGGAGDDVYFVDNAGDIVVEQQNAGIDEVRSSAASYTLGDFVNNLTLLSGAVNGTGNAIENVITGNAATNRLSGGDGNDTLTGAGGNDTLSGGTGSDHFIFNVAPGSANAGVVTDFASGTDVIRVDGKVMPAVGASGSFASGDARFYAAAGANAGHDADDRVVYNITTGQLWYDGDGSGSGAAQLIATLQGAPALAATDIRVDNGTSTTPPPAGSITGTEGDDTLAGTTGNDSIYGLGGNDFITGDSGADTIVGGAGNDTIYGNGGNDWVEGGTGNDSMSGGGDQDSFVFREYGAQNADTVGGFDTNCAAGDARFYAAAGASGGHDADDRLVYNTSTGQLFYDADGSGAGAAQLVATLQGAPGVAAADVWVI
ncbi:MAG: calcium-binding protein, partial [Betaproteobacteria bacterium]